MRATHLVLLVGLLAVTALAVPAAADITVNRLPVHACVSGTCTPCLDPITVPEPVIEFTLTGADC